MIGKSIPRIDAEDKVTGKTLYTMDMAARFPESYFVEVLRSPYAHASILKLDTTYAESMPGVACVITGEDSEIKWDAFPPHSKLAKSETIWAGQPIALVVAKTKQLAQSAAKQIIVEYKPLPHVLNWAEAASPSPVSIVDPTLSSSQKDPEGIFTSPNVSGVYHLRKGNTEQAFATCDVIVEEEFSTGKKTHSQMECAMAIVQYHSKNNMTIWCNGCGIHTAIKERLCQAFGLPSSSLRVLQPQTGGSFGNRNSPYVEFLCMLAATKAKRTVSLSFSREEMFIGAPSNWSCTTKIKLGATLDGKILAKEVLLLEDIGASVGVSSYTGRTSSSSLTSIYSIPNVRMDTCAILTNTVPAGSYRGLGSPEASFALESTIDSLAEKLNMSPLDLRQKNILSKGEENDYGETITSIGVAQCLQSVSDAIFTNVPIPESDSNWRYGRGLACACKQNAPTGRSEAEIKIFHDGSIHLLLSLDRHGMGASTALLQIAADMLSVSPDRILLVECDTSFTPFDTLSASSRSIYSTGNAVRYACADALNQLKNAAAEYAGIHPNMVEIRNLVAYFTGSHLDPIPVSELFASPSPYTQNIWGLKQGTPVIGKGIFSHAPAIPWDRNGQTPHMWNWFQYAAAAVEIGIHMQTGQIKVLRIANAADSGNPINPKLVESQIDGASLMAIGFCLQEEHLYDNNGRIANASFGEYRLPNTLSMPEIQNVLSLICPDPLPDGPYGAKGMSESVVSPIGPAIAAAVYQATGVRLHFYPMTAERVLNAISSKGETL